MRIVALTCLLVLTACGSDEVDYDGTTTFAVHDAAEAEAKRAEDARQEGL